MKNFDKQCDKLLALVPALAKRFKSLEKRHSTLRKKIEAAVRTIEWCRAERYSPISFDVERHGRKPSRPMKTAPVETKGLYAYGLDDEGRVLFADNYGLYGGKAETLWEYTDWGIDTASFDVAKKELVNVATTLIEDGSPIGFIRYAIGGISIDAYEWKKGLLVRARLATVIYDDDGEEEHQVDDVYTDEFSYAGAQLVKIERAWATGEREELFTQKEIEMKLDLRKDLTAVKAYLAKRVRDFDTKKHQGPGDPGKVKMIEVGYECAQAGWVAVVFDTRPEAEPDGEWTLHIDGINLAMPHWKELCKGNEERPIMLVNTDGAKTVIPPGAGLEEPIGEMLKTALLGARSAGAFKALPKASGCELGIEHLEGAYGWPEFKNRGKENLAEK